MKTYFGTKNPPVRIAGIAIGDGTLGNNFVNTDLPVVRIEGMKTDVSLIELSYNYR